MSIYTVNFRTAPLGEAEIPPEVFESARVGRATQALERAINNLIITTILPSTFFEEGFKDFIDDSGARFGDGLESFDSYKGESSGNEISIHYDGIFLNSRLVFKLRTEEGDAPYLDRTSIMFSESFVESEPEIYNNIIDLFKELGLEENKPIGFDYQHPKLEPHRKEVTNVIRKFTKSPMWVYERMQETLEFVGEIFDHFDFAPDYISLEKSDSGEGLRLIRTRDLYLDIHPILFGLAPEIMRQVVDNASEVGVIKYSNCRGRMLPGLLVKQKRMIRAGSELYDIVKKMFPGAMSRSTIRLTQTPNSFDYDNEKDVIKYSVNGRETIMRPGKGLKKFASTYVSEFTWDDNTLKTYTNLLKAGVSNTLEVVTGSDITHYYHEDQYNPSERTGSLSSSCMRYPNCQSWVALYETIADGMLILKDAFNPEKIIGRALLWTTEEGDKFMDRVYGAEHNYEYFFKWAKENGYYRKRYQAYDSYYTVVTPGGAEIEKSMTIRLSPEGLDNRLKDKIPYFDTFRHYCIETGLATNCKRTSEKWSNESNQEHNIWNIQNQYGVVCGTVYSVKDEYCILHNPRED